MGISIVPQLKFIFNKLGEFVHDIIIVWIHTECVAMKRRFWKEVGTEGQHTKSSLIFPLISIPCCVKSSIQKVLTPSPLTADNHYEKKPQPKVDVTQVKILWDVNSESLLGKECLDNTLSEK